MSSSETRFETAALEVSVLREELAAERKIAEISQAFLGLERDELEPEIERALAAAAALADADSAQLISVRRDARPGAELERHVWHASREPDMRERDTTSFAEYRWLLRRLTAGEVIHVPDVDAMPDEAARERSALKEIGNVSYLAFPVRSSGRLIGYLDFRTVGRKRTWSDREIERLRFISEVFSSVLQRKHEDDAKHEGEERFRALTENLTETLCESDEAGNLLYASPRMQALLGYPPDEVWNLSLSDLVHPEDRHALIESYASARARNADTASQFRARHRDGSWRWLEAVGRSYRAACGERRFVTILRDVTEANRRNAELEQKLRLESLLADLSSRLLSTDTSEIGEVIQYSLQSLAEAAGAQRSFLVSFPERREGHDGETFFFEWCADGIARRPSIPDGRDRTRYPGFSKKVFAGELVCVTSVADLPDECAIERAEMQAAGIRAYLLIPTMARGRVVGLLCLHCVTGERQWSEEEITLLRLVGNLFTSVVRRRRNEEALSASEERFRALAENSRDSIAEISADGRLLYASPAYANLVGRERTEIEGLPVDRLVHPEDRARVASELQRSLRSELDGTLIYRSQHRDGSWVHLEASLRAFARGSGEQRVVAVLRDVSEREHGRRVLQRQFEMEKAVAELSRFFLDLGADAIRDGLRDKLATAGALADAEHSWLYTLDPRQENEEGWYEACAVDGVGSERPPPEVSMSEFRDALPALLDGDEIHVASLDELPEEAAAERRHLTGRGVRSFLGIPLVFERRLIGFMGFDMLTREHRWPEETIRMLRLVGEIFASALRREQADIELRRSQAQLLQSQKMEAVGTLAGGIAHDFNNHLAVMLGNTRFVRDQIDGNPQLRDALADLQTSAEHCAQLTRSLLAFSRRTPASIQAVGVSSVVAAVSELIRPLLPRSIHLEIEPADRDDAVRADPIQLRQVLINLLVNARDAMPEGGRLRLDSRRRTIGDAEAQRLQLPAPGDYVELRVRDTGYGMDERTAARIFEPFFTTKPHGRGTGLGLATAYGIITQSNGAIEVETEPGAGSLFRVLLPREEHQTDHAPASAGDPLPGSETILLVEDEPAVRRLVARILRRYGYRVLEAIDGVEALGLFERGAEQIDLVVTDLVMPRMGGIELADQLQRTGLDIPILFLSGHADPSDVATGARLADVHLLQKPFDAKALLTGVRELLD